MSLDDLESKLLSEPAPKAARKPAPVKKEKAAPKKKEEAPVAVPPPAPAPTKKERASKTKYVELPPAPAPVKAPKAAPVKAERKPREEKRPAPVAKAVAAAEKDPNASTLGVALGAAPLLVAPLVALAGARGALSKTQARRAQIQKEIEEKEKEAARKRVERSADADGGGIASAFVSLVFLSFDEFFVVCTILYGTVFIYCLNAIILYLHLFLSLCKILSTHILGTKSFLTHRHSSEPPPDLSDLPSPLHSVDLACQSLCPRLLKSHSVARAPVLPSPLPRLPSVRFRLPRLPRVSIHFAFYILEAGFYCTKLISTFNSQRIRN